MWSKDDAEATTGGTPGADEATIMAVDAQARNISNHVVISERESVVYWYSI